MVLLKRCCCIIALKACGLDCATAAKDKQVSRMIERIFFMLVLLMKCFYESILQK